MMPLFWKKYSTAFGIADGKLQLDQKLVAAIRFKFIWDQKFPKVPYKKEK